MNELVSVIVPVYNVERYLTKSVNSIIRQTYKNLEIILVDDGSPDNSPKMCDDFAKKDYRVKVIHKENGGVSSARNTGIEEATGKYIMFVDSDDWLPRKAIELLIEKTEKEQADFCYGATVEIAAVNNGKKNNYSSQTIYKKESEKLIDFFENTFLSPWAKLFKTEILKENNIKFPLGVAYSEDTWFLFRYLQKCNKLCCINPIVYCYNEIVSGCATSKYHADIYKWHTAWIEELAVLFDEEMKKQEVACYVGKYGIDCFDGCCKLYIKHSNILGSDKMVVEKIEQAYSSLKKYIDLFEQNRALCKDEFKLKKFDFYDKYIKESNFEALRSAISQQRIEKVNPVKQKLRRIIVAIKILILFKIFK